MEMDATGKSKGQWLFHGNFDRTVNYLSDHSRILNYNPFCHKVEPLDREEAYRWHFRVTDPQNNPFDVIFNIQQATELLLELPEEMATIDTDHLTDEMISDYTVGRKITWRYLPATETIAMPDKYLFEGRVRADMLISPFQSEKTRVDFDLQIDVHFTLYPAFQVIPEKIIRTMTNAGMSFIMQTATNKMFQSISNDFGTIRQL